MWIAPHSLDRLTADIATSNVLGISPKEGLEGGLKPGRRVSEIMAEAGIDKAVIARVRSQTVDAWAHDTLSVS